MCSDNKADNDSDNNSGVVKVLAFHKVQAKFSFGSTNYSPKRFIKLILYLKDKGFNFVSLNDALVKTKSENIVISFDDGYQHLMDIIPELMDDYKITPLVFIPTFFIGNNNSWDYSSLFQKIKHLGKSDIQQLAQCGVEFASHGHTHQPLTRLSSGVLRSELEFSRKILEDITGQEIKNISYPFGRYNKQVIDETINAGYINGFRWIFRL